MMGASHLLHGVTTAAWTAYVLPIDHGMAVMVGVVGAGYALAPDLDHASSRASHSTPDAKYLSAAVRSFGKHRTWTHDPRIGPPIFAAVTGALVALLAPPIGDYWWAFALAALIGCLTHIYGDARTVSGVPLGRRRVHIGITMTTGSDRELALRAWLYRPIAVASVLGAGWLTLH